MTDKIDLIYDLLKDVDRKNDEQNERLVRLEVNTDRNTEDLAHHIKRTDLLEQSLNKTKAGVAKKIAELEAPKNTAKTLAKWVAGIAGFVATVAAAIFGVMRIMKL